MARMSEVNLPESPVLAELTEFEEWCRRRSIVLHRRRILWRRVRVTLSVTSAAGSGFAAMAAALGEVDSTTQRVIVGGAALLSTVVTSVAAALRPGDEALRYEREADAFFDLAEQAKRLRRIEPLRTGPDSPEMIERYDELLSARQRLLALPPPPELKAQTQETNG